MDAAIAKILSDDIDIDDEEKLDFGEAGSDSEGEEEDAVEVASEEEGGAEEGSKDGSDVDDDAEHEEQTELDAGLDDPDSDAESKEDAEVSGSDGDAELGAEPEQRKSFLEGGKADTFARAFARIMEAPDSKATGSQAPILTGSKSVSKRAAEGAEASKADRAAKRLRQDMRVRGHVVPARRGDDPEADAREKALQRVATRGVVRLFNAVSKAQRRLKDAEAVTGSKGRAARLGKASFLAELRGARTEAGGGESLVPSCKAAGGPEGGEGGEAAAGWDVLKDGFTGLAGSGKMKDWDRRQSDEEDAEEGGRAEDSDGGDSDGDEGW